MGVRGTRKPFDKELESDSLLAEAFTLPAPSAERIQDPLEKLIRSVERPADHLCRAAITLLPPDCPAPSGLSPDLGFRSGGETRTRNLPVNSRPLYQLSYPGMRDRTDVRRGPVYQRRPAPPAFRRPVRGGPSERASTLAFKAAMRSGSRLTGTSSSSSGNI